MAAHLLFLLFWGMSCLPLGSPEARPRLVLSSECHMDFIFPFWEPLGYVGFPHVQPTLNVVMLACESASCLLGDRTAGDNPPPRRACAPPFHSRRGAFLFIESDL